MGKFIKGLSKFIVYLVLIIAILFFPIFFLFDRYFYLNSPMELNLSSSVGIVANGSEGSGVVFKNNGRLFVWTCAHVVEGSVTNSVSVNLLTGKAIVQCWSDDVAISLKLFDNNQKEYGEVRLWSKVIRYSAAEDIAILEIPPCSLFPNSVIFPLDYAYKGKPGMKVFHIGCMNGAIGHKSIVEGIHGIGGLILGDKYYDRLGLCIQPGSSGGGVYDSVDGKCIGLIAKSNDAKAFNQAYMISWHRMVDFAQRMDCMWALDGSYEVPSDYLDKFTDDEATIPIEFLRQFFQKIPRDVNPSH